MTEKSKSLYQRTYQSMIDRTHEDGYADTSITGHYQGMFCRDTSIQIMCHIAHGDYDRAKLLMTYILDYHVNNNYDFAIHVIYENHEPSLRIQADTTFFFLHAWYLYAVKAPETAEKKAFLEKYYGKIKTFANFYLDRGNLDNEFDLLFNENLEHSRCGDYWFSYDLLTNVYASQALHEMADYFKAKDVDNAEKWEAAAAKIVAGVHKNLVTEIDGKVMYAELMGKTETTVKNAPETPDQFIQGFSWVNLAPMGCDWYGADPEILENTYRLYLKYGACDYYNKYYMLNVVSDFNGSP
ncbi:MAG: hypothetical protein IKM39_05285, partial [Clostridia bacterium]|nr:hypothetical protein [Clostridia bacterium]